MALISSKATALLSNHRRYESTEQVNPCGCVYIYITIYIYTQICTSMHAHVHIHMYIYIHIDMSMYLYQQYMCLFLQVVKRKGARSEGSGRLVGKEMRPRLFVRP